MLLSVKQLQINIEFNERNREDKIPIVFLHGFTGCALDWYFLKDKIHQNYFPVFIDLLGHGKSSSPTNPVYYTADSQIEILNQIFEILSFDKIVLMGYSMGGRIALNYWLKNSGKVNAVILESASFGIASENERRERVLNDKKLAKIIESNSMEEFINYWLSTPLFEHLSSKSQSKFLELKRNKILSNDKIGLINSLLGFSTGKMEYSIPFLSHLWEKCLLISGKEDIKFSNIAKDANLRLLNSDLQIVDNCGHNVHFENPEEFLKLLNNFLINIW